MKRYKNILCISIVVLLIVIVVGSLSSTFFTPIEPTGITSPTSTTMPTLSPTPEPTKYPSPSIASLVIEPTIEPTIEIYFDTPTPIIKKSRTVYITRTGEKYHRAGCRYLRQSCIPVKLSIAQSQGYSPCSVCDP